MAVHQPEHAQHVRHLLGGGALGPHQDCAPAYKQVSNQNIYSVKGSFLLNAE